MNRLNSLSRVAASSTVSLARPSQTLTLTRTRIPTQTQTRSFSEGPDAKKYHSTLYPPPRPHRQRLNRFYDALYKPFVALGIISTIGGFIYMGVILTSFHMRSRQVVADKPLEVAAFIAAQNAKKLQEEIEADNIKNKKAQELRERLGLKPMSDEMLAEAAHLRPSRSGK